MPNASSPKSGTHSTPYSLMQGFFLNSFVHTTRRCGSTTEIFLWMAGTTTSRPYRSQNACCQCCLLNRQADPTRFRPIPPPSGTKSRPSPTAPPPMARPLPHSFSSPACLMLTASPPHQLQPLPQHPPLPSHKRLTLSLPQSRTSHAPAKTSGSFA